MLASPFSIITAVHNALPMNQLFWQALSQNTRAPFELIVIDNHSTDGTGQFFKGLSQTELKSGQSIVYVRNEKNQSYPASQNQGMRLANHDLLCFMNNDVWVPPGWHEPVERALKENPNLVVSPSGQEAQPTQTASTRLKLRWRRITFFSRLWKLCLFRSELDRLWKSLEWMYGDLELFESPTWAGYKKYMHGIKGDVVAFHRHLLDRVPGIWDERVQAADWHLYLTLAKLNEEDPTLPLPRILLDSFVHHFGRYSARQKFDPIVQEERMLKIEELWSRDLIQRLWWGNFLPD